MNAPLKLTALLLVLCLPAAAALGEEPSLWEIQQILISKRLVDLTHAFRPGIPHWKGFPEEIRKEVYTYEKGGFWAQEFTHVGQWGTHVDPPAHFHEGLRTVDEIPPVEMILPLVVLDVHQKVATDPDYLLSVSDVQEWEARHGEMPRRAFVAMRSDWSKRWPDPAAMANKDEQGVAHYPGWSLAALELLIEKRRAVAIGHETTDTDPGIRTSRDDYSAESYVLGQNRYQIELMANLDQLPEAGALLICTWPKPLAGSGFPARLLAIVP